MSQRITQYIKENYGIEAFEAVRAGKTTVVVNGQIVDGTAQNFRDRRVTETTKVILEPSKPETNLREEIIKIAPEVTELVTEETPVEMHSHDGYPEHPVVRQHAVLLSEEVKRIEEEPVPKSEVRTKKCYGALKAGKPIPAGAIIHTSKSGKQYFEKVIGEDKYV